MLRWVLIAAAVSGAVAIALGAIGAHALADAAGGRSLAWFDTASRYHLLHSLALLAVALAPGAGARRAPCVVASVLWLAGIVVFCGSLYGLAMFDQPRLGAITPLGGVAFIAGWLALVFAARPSEREVGYRASGRS